MILKFYWWFLNLYDVKNHFWNHKNVGHVIADRGLRSGTPRWGYPSHRYRGGPLPFTKPWAATPLRRPLQASNVQMIVTNDESFPWLTTQIWHWPEPNKWQMIPRQITMSLDRQNCAYKTCQHGTAELFTSSGQGLLIFDPLDNGNLALRINYQKVSRLNESQEVGMKWGLGRSTSFHTSM